jgi:NAD(P)-dependent dehydrogenase (short-subunit alcohol dehydrogenase family)
MDDVPTSSRTEPLTGLVVGGDPASSGAIRAALDADGVTVLDTPDEGSGVDVLVFIARNAAAPIATTSVTDFSGRLGGELKAAFLALQRGVAAIRAKGAGGAVVFVAPPAAGHRSFDALQQGLRLLAKAAALELGPEGIRVNIVLPGAGATPLGRPCTPADVAASVAFAASPRAHFMTGADLVVDGGRLSV